MKAEATEKHPAQVEVYYEDVVVGHWRTVKFSGALPASRVKELLERVDKLQQAVKFAREEANDSEVTDQQIGDRDLRLLAVGHDLRPGSPAPPGRAEHNLKLMFRLTATRRQCGFESRPRYTPG